MSSGLRKKAQMVATEITRTTAIRVTILIGGLGVVGVDGGGCRGVARCGGARGGAGGGGGCRRTDRVRTFDGPRLHHGESRHLVVVLVLISSILGGGCCGEVVDAGSHLEQLRFRVERFVVRRR